MPCNIEKESGLETHIFDICGTLYHSNTTYDFLLFYFKKYNFIKYFVCRIALSLPGKMAIVSLSKINKLFDIRKRLISTLKNEDKEIVDRAAELFVREYLPNRMNGQIHRILEEAKRNQHNIILVSASIFPVVNAIAEQLGIKRYMATTLGIDSDNKYTGFIVSDVKGKKLRVWEEMGLEKGLILSVATDNLDDIDLINKCDKAIIVSKKKNLTIWKTQLGNHQNWRFVNV